MTGTVDRLESESFELATIVRHSDGSIRAISRREMVWWLEFASRHPVNPWSFHIESREMYDPCELCDREDHRRFREFFQTWERVKSLYLLHDEGVATWVREDVHTACELFEEEVIGDTITSIFHDVHLHAVSISFELGFCFFFAFLFVILMVFSFSSVSWDEE